MTAETRASGPIAVLPAIVADSDIIDQARSACASMYRARGMHAMADEYERGEWDWTWAMRHQVSKVIEDLGR